MTERRKFAYEPQINGNLSANGWHAVIVGAKVGWVSGKYSRVI